VAGPATTGNTFVFNNMQGSPLPLPATSSLKPGEELKLQLEMMMHQGMGGPHLFRLRLLVAGEGGEAHPPLELYIRAFFG